VASKLILIHAVILSSTAISFESIVPSGLLGMLSNKNAVLADGVDEPTDPVPRVQISAQFSRCVVKAAVIVPASDACL
jgi:hypothetical protein